MKAPTKNRVVDKVLMQVSESIVKAGAKWPPDCGGLIYQPERPRVKLDELSKDKTK